MQAPEDGTVWNWLVGGAVGIATGAFGLVYRKASKTQADLAAHMVEDVKAYALKSDVQALRDHVDDRFSTLLMEQKTGFEQVLLRLDQPRKR